MAKYKKSYPVFVVAFLLSVLLYNFNVSIADEITGPPNITGLNPITAVQGQTGIEIYGSNFSEQIKLESTFDSTIVNVLGSPDISLTTTVFDIPLDVQPGVYKITVTNMRGSDTSNQLLTIKVSGDFFEQPVSPVVPSEGLPTDLGQLIQQIFLWSLGVLGISIFVIMFYAGFMMLTAAGNTSKWNDAKSKMTNAILGAILLLSAYLILYTINPDFVKSTFNLPGLK